MSEVVYQEVLTLVELDEREATFAPPGADWEHRDIYVGGLHTHKMAVIVWVAIGRPITITLMIAL